MLFPNEFAQLLLLSIVIITCCEKNVIEKCSQSKTVMDFKEVDNTTCDDIVTITKYGYKFTDIQCKFPFDTEKFRQLPPIDATSTEKLSFTDCVFDENTAARYFLEIVDINEYEVFLVHLNYMDCRFMSSILMDSHLLNLFEDSLRILKIFSRDVCGLRINISPTSLSPFKVLEEITFSRVQLTGLGALVTPPKIKNIFLENARLDDHDDHVFSALSPTVKRAEIINCTIKNFGRDFFKNIAEIDELKVEGAVSAKQFPSDIFHDLIKLRELVLIEDKIEKLQNALLDANLVLTSFNISAKSLTEISENLFRKLVFLRKLTILNTQIESLPENLLHNCTKLTDLTINSNAIRIVPAAFFKYQESMVHIIMKDNQIEEIAVGTFSNLKFCKTLNLSGNKITSIPNKFFDGMSALSGIFLNNNRITDLGPAAFLYCQNLILTSIVLADNPLGVLGNSDVITKQFSSMSGIQHLDLRNTSLKGISTKHFLAIEKVDLSDNQIEVIGFFQSLDPRWLNYPGRNNVMFLVGNVLRCDCEALEFLRYLQSSKDPLIEIGSSKCSSPEGMAKYTFRSVDPMGLVCRTESCPEACSCLQRPADASIIVGCNNKNFLKVPELPNHVPLSDGNFSIHVELHIENNKITSFPSNDPRFRYVNRIFARNNSIGSLVNLATQLKFLDVRGNKLQALDAETLSLFRSSNSSLFLSDNPWTCDCTILDFLAFSKSGYNKVKDFELITCDGTGRSLTDIDAYEVCLRSYILIMTFVSITIGLVGLAIGVYYKYQKIIKIFLFSHGFWLVSEDDIDEDKLYDAFIIFTENDLHHVENIVMELEGGQKSFKCCVHFRDFTAGEFITEQIHNAILQSRRTIVFVSEHFKNSKWAQYEFRIAQSNSIDDKLNCKRMIVIVKGELNEVMTENLDEDLKDYLKQVTFIKFEDKWFWKKLMYSMPHSRRLNLEPVAATSAV